MCVWRSRGVGPDRRGRSTTFDPPLVRAVEKPHKRSAVNFTPPLRGSRGGRAVYAKADSVGGESRFIATPSYTPHRIAFGLTPSALRLPLKGGVVVGGSTRGEWFGAIRKGFSNNPLRVRHLLIRTPDPHGGLVSPLVGRSVPSYIRIFSITPLRAGRFFSHT